MFVEIYDITKVLTASHSVALRPQLDAYQIMIRCRWCWWIFNQFLPQPLSKNNHLF